MYIEKSCFELKAYRRDTKKTKQAIVFMIAAGSLFLQLACTSYIVYQFSLFFIWMLKCHCLFYQQRNALDSTQPGQGQNHSTNKVGQIYV
jgi:hypothetical protein